MDINRERLIEEVLKPVVRIRTSKATGSGTIIKSDKDGTYLQGKNHEGN